MMKADVNSRPAVASLYSGGSGSAQPSRSHPFSSIATSPDGSYAVAGGKDVLHVLRLNLDQIEEIRSVRISQVRCSSLCSMFVCNAKEPVYTFPPTQINFYDISSISNHLFLQLLFQEVKIHNIHICVMHCVSLGQLIQLLQLYQLPRRQGAGEGLISTLMMLHGVCLSHM